MKYNFDEIIDRKNTNSMNTDGWRSYIFRCGPDRKFPYADDEFIRMWVADMDFAVASEIQEAIKERVDRQIFGYTMVSDTGYYEAFEKWCKDRYDWSFKREELVFSLGVVPALYQLIEDLAKPAGAKVITMTPVYGYFLHACEYNGVELAASPLKKINGRFDIDFDDLESKAGDPSAAILLLCNPHNPTGRMWTEAELKRIAEIAEKNNLWVISDEIHCDLLRRGNRHIPMGRIMPEYPRLVTAMSASKTFNIAGLLQTNIIIRDKEERTRFKRRDKMTGSVNPLSLAAHKAAYEKGADWLLQLQEYIDGNFRLVKEFIGENLPGAEFEIPEATYFAWINMNSLLPDIEDLPLFFAENAGVLLEGGDRLFAGNAGGYIRLNLAMPRDVVRTGLERIAGAVRNHIGGK